MRISWRAIVIPAAILILWELAARTGVVNLEFLSRPSAILIAGISGLADGTFLYATWQTFEAALRSLRPGGTLSSLGVYAGKLQLPYDAFAAGLGDHRIVTTLCPGGKERMRRLMAMVEHGRLDLTPLVTHRMKLADIADAYALFAERRDGVLKVAIEP